MKFTRQKALKFGWKGIKGWAYNSKDDFKDASATYIETTGKHGKVKNRKSNRIYLVLDGKGRFDIDGKKISVQKDDVIIVPKNTPYDYKTTSKELKLFLIHSPAFDEKADLKL